MGYYFRGVMSASHDAIHSAAFVQTLFLSHSLEIKPISRRNARHLVSLTSHRRPHRLVVSHFTHRPLIPVTRVYSC